MLETPIHVVEVESVFPQFGRLNVKTAGQSYLHSTREAKECDDSVQSSLGIDSDPLQGDVAIPI